MHNIYIYMIHVIVSWHLIYGMPISSRFVSAQCSPSPSRHETVPQVHLVQHKQCTAVWGRQRSLGSRVRTMDATFVGSPFIAAAALALLDCHVVSCAQPLVALVAVVRFHIVSTAFCIGLAMVPLSQRGLSKDTVMEKHRKTQALWGHGEQFE